MKYLLSLALALAAGAAWAQTTSVAVDPDGRLHGSASAGDAPSVSVEAGSGRVRSTVKTPRQPGFVRVEPACRDHGVTVRSADGAAVSSAWVSGPGSATVAGAGSPGSTVRTYPCPPDRDPARATSPPRRSK
jgi:hypothetical protein